MKLLVRLPFLLLLTLLGCGDGSPTASPAASGESGSDAAAQPVADGGTDANTDAGSHARVDAGTDANTDGGTNARADAGTNLAPDAAATPAADAGPPVTASTIRIHYPRVGHTLSIRGALAPLSWTQGVTTSELADGWSWASTNLTAASDFKPLLDDATWSIGPNYRVSPGETIDIYPRFRPGAGSYSVRWPAFASATLGRSRKVWVYLPPGYDENTVARFPVVYMHDGQNLFDRNAPFGFWHTDETLDEGAANGQIREAIVVGPEATSARTTEYTPSFDTGRGTGGGASAYITSLVSELKPLVDQELRTLPARETTAIMGSSLGGLVSSWAGVHHASTFGLVGAMSPSTWWDGAMILGEVSTTNAQSHKPLRVYIDSGDAGPSLDDNVNTALLAGRYRGAGYVDTRDLLYVLAPGHQHNEAYWAQRLPRALGFLLGARPHTGSMP